MFARISVELEMLTGFVVTGKVKELVPPGTVTDAGTVAAAGFELESARASPEAATTPRNRTVAVTAVPPFTELALSVIMEIVGIVTVNTAETGEPAPLAVMVTSADTLTGAVVNVK